MDLAVPPELEELIICSCCHLPFNDNDCVPKLFTCRHYFCLKCVNSLQQEGSDELYCVHCWKRTTLQSPDATPESLPTYNAILYLTQNLNTLSLKSQSGQSGGVSKQRSSSTTSTSSNGGSCSKNNGGSGSSNNNSNNCNTNNNHNSNGNGNLNNISGSSSGLSANGNSGSCDMQSNNSNKINSKMGENCMTHAMPNTLWCSNCSMLVCRACSASEEHRTHAVKNQLEARETIQTDISNELLSMQKTLNDVQHLVLKQRDFLLKILESCTALKTQIETELINHIPTLEIAEMRENLGKAKLCLDMLDKQSPAEALKLYTTLRSEKQRLMAKYREMFLQCKLDDLIRNYGYIFDFDLIKQALMQLHSCVLNGGSLEEFGFGIGLGGAAGGQNDLTTHHNPVLLLANYCISQLYSRQMLLLKQQQHQQQQQQQQKQQQQQQQQLHNNGNHATSSAMTLGLSINMNGVGGGSYAQALQSSAQQQQQQQKGGGPTSPPVVKTYADITTSSPKANQQLHHPSRHMLQQQPQSNNNFSDIGPIGTPLRCTSNLFPCSTADLNGLGLSMFQIQQQQQQQQHSQQQQKHSKSPTAVGGNMLLNPSVHVYPIYFFNIEINGQPSGRVLIEVRNDVAPKMAKNFGALATHELGFGYKGCHIFQCWDCESIITGDFELNNGRGGRSVYDEGYFMPDDTKIMAIRGSVGMRRSQKRHDNLGLVGSQFRVILREMRGFTGIFAFVVDGLELIEKISQFGDTTGKPQSSVVIVNCGKYHVG